MILCQNARDEDKTDQAEVTQPALGMVRALRENGIPVKVLTREGHTEDDLRKVALAVEDVVTMTDYETVSGLERRVVIGIEGKDRKRAADGERYVDANRLHAISRCTAQLVWIGQPSD